MDALAETWSRSGRRSDDLYKGKTEEIIKELKTWILERQALNGAIISLLWDLFATNDIIFGIPDQSKNLGDMRMAFKAKHVKNVERVKEYKEKRDAQTLQAEFLLVTLSHQGLTWKELPSTPGWTETDADVCSFLNTRDRTFDAERQLKILENNKKIAEWQLEYERRERNEDEDMLATNDADDDDSIPRRRPDIAVAVPGDEVDYQETWGSHRLAVPVNVTGLLPPVRRPSYDTPNRPPSYDSPDCTISPDTIDRVKMRVEALSETHESAEAIARRIENMSITGKPVKTEKLSKAKIRDMRRKKAKDRAKEAGDAEEAPGDDGGEGGSREQVS